MRVSCERDTDPLVLSSINEKVSTHTVAVDHKFGEQSFPEVSSSLSSSPSFLEHQLEAGNVIFPTMTVFFASLLR